MIKFSFSSKKGNWHKWVEVKILDLEVNGVKIEKYAVGISLLYS